MNKKPKLKRPEDVDTIYYQLAQEDCSLAYIYNEVENYLNPNVDIGSYYGAVPATINASDLNDLDRFTVHTFNFLWLILCIEGYES